MKLGLLGDIHGNSLALAAVLEAIKKAQVECLLITGDLIGYYFSPRKVLDLLKPWKKYMVRGNHEDLLSRVLSNSSALTLIEKKYGKGLRMAIQQLSDEELHELTNLPHPVEIEIDKRRFLLCHGSPWDNSYYIYPDANVFILEKCASYPCDAVIMGHTHYPMVHKINHCLLINPGSVGQPRNRQPGASWALLNTDSLEVELRHETYDASALVREAMSSHPDLPYLAEVLQRT